MSESNTPTNIDMYREVAEMVFPNRQLSDEEIVLVGLAYSAGYRDSYDSLKKPVTETAPIDKKHKKRRGE